ncbi:hypothetical protein AQUSIP_18380 [Aquicella siphonis]|uniref:TonB C-terminal domain-containing protein n=1 Tax=Aquicella siphonis TaxID=254247 RepID=A0A5E4PJC4_9COXI|nr:TonB family protein [Aquicella siphonis]VVC76523.1 hypothetical protein AQUSIP_18380 [Aquicella siphonis]
MKTLKNSKSFHYTASIVTHALVFFLMVAVFDAAKEMPLLGNTAVNTVNSYVMNERDVQAVSRNPSQAARDVRPPVLKERETVTAEKPAERALVIRQKKTEPVEAAHQSEIRPSASGISQGARTEALLAMLHAAIQKQQRYPVSAVQMEREGRATVKFTLFTDGSISSLRIVNSSGTDSLDGAALAAVRDAAPFAQVKQYLDSAREFSIDVVFELA